MKIETLKVYPHRDDVTLTAYILENSPEILADTKRPGVLICPGGGYFGCSDREAEPLALKFATMGYHAFVLRYSVQNENGLAAPNEGGPIVKPQLLHPAPVREIGMSFMLLHAHADEWLLDATKIAICGFSAGGHNCAMYAAYWNTDLVRGALGASSDVLRPAAAILSYPVIDYVYIMEHATEDWENNFFAASNITFLGTSRPSAEVIDEISPARHVTADTPPCFIWATAADDLVPVQHSLLMAQACANAGVPFEMHIYENGVHGLSLANISTSCTQKFLDPTAAEWITHAEEFLKRRFAVEDTLPQT